MTKEYRSFPILQEEKSYSRPMQEISYIPGMAKLDYVRELILKASEEGSGKGTLAEWSRKLGKNHAYLHQFIHKGTPRKLSEGDRHKLAGLMDVAEWMLAAHDAQPRDPDWVPRPTSGILEIDVRAGLGGGGTTDGREVRHDGDYADPVKPEAWHFPTQFMREEVRASNNQVIIFATDGDSMEPTIGSGERIVVHTGMKTPSPDGIFALRDTFGNIIAKRLQVLRKGDPPRVLIISDNKSHPTEEVGLEEIEDMIVGRVLWGLRRL